jgi:ribose transport system permease protein
MRPTMKANLESVSPGEEAAPPDSRAQFGERAFSVAQRQLGRYGVPLAIVATFAVFSLLRPDSFFTELTIKGILRDCVPLMIVSLGITTVLAMNDYDLSVGGLISLCATIVVVFISTTYVDMNYIVAILLTIVIGGLLGLANGLLVAYVRLPSFILTIATGTIFAGLALEIVSSQSVFEGIPGGFIDIASGTFLGFSHQVFIGLVVLVLAQLFLRHTEYGRYMYAIGGNPEAARLSGVRVRMLRAVGFSLVGVSAAIAGVLINSAAGASNPNTGLGLLLPAYAAAFLGSSMFRVGLFTPLGTALGALYLQIIGTGLTILNLTGPVVQMIQGGILVAAVLVSRLTRSDEHR